jgi:transcriptional regulator with XRE-family HTH domain
MKNTRHQTRIIAFGAHLRRLRTAKKWTMKDLAFEADVELSQVHRIEKGKINPTLTTILILADALGEPATSLLNFSY